MADLAAPRWQRVLAGVLAPALVLLCLVRLGGLWPCDVACAGGGHYRTLLGMDVLWPAVTAYLVLSWLVVRDARRGAWGAVAVHGVVALAGISLFFLCVAWQLRLVCLFCFVVHGVVLALASLIVPGAITRFGSALIVSLLAGLLGANAVFHHRAVVDVALPASPVIAQPSPVADVRGAAADLNRSRGRAAAPLVLEAVLDLNCPHCAASWSSLARAIAPAVAAGRARLVVRLVVRRSEPASRDLARWAFAAALRSAADHGRFVVDHLGTRSGLAAAEIIAANPDLASLAAEAKAEADVVDRLVDDDQRRIATLGLAATPLLVLGDRSGRVRARWQGDIDAAAVSAALETP